MRLDVLVTKSTKDLTRSQAAKLIAVGLVEVDGKVITRPSANVSEDAKLKVSKPKSKLEVIKLTIIYEDKDVIVINKPAGILAHSKGTYTTEATVADWLAAHLKSKLKTNRDGIVHRLDRSTSGLMILAKSNEAQKWLMKQFSTRKVKKTYMAVVSGHLKEQEALIDMPIERNPKKPQTFRVGSNGKSAQTKYKVIKEGALTSLVELTPTTGRTHQLRVHMAGISHPIVGDTLYGNKPAERLFLHALKLELTLPNGETKEFTTKLPASFNKAIL